MQIQTLLLELFASIALISAIMVIGAQNPIHSVIFLILVFCNATGLLILLKIEFIALMFLIIYVGAIAVLFLFVVMMLNIKLSELSQNWLRYLPIGGLISLIFLTEVFLIVDNDFCTAPVSPWWTNWGNETALTQVLQEYSILNYEFFQDQKSWTNLIDSVTNIESLGYLIYTYFFYYFILASLILLLAMIGAIVLTMHKKKYASKKQLIFKQIERSFQNAISYVGTK